MERISQKKTWSFCFFLIILIACQPSGETTSGDTYTCKEDCEGLAVKPIKNQLILTVDPTLPGGELADLLENLPDSVRVTECMCNSNLILLDNVQGIEGEESLGQGRGSIKQNGINAYLNIPINIGDPGLPTFIPATDTTFGKAGSVLNLAVIDGGINKDEEDLSPFIWRNANESLNSNDDDGNCLVDDIKGWDFSRPSNSAISAHGTLLAKISTNNLNDNEIGVIDLRVFTKDGAGSLFDALCAMEYARDKSQIINMSWGYYSSATPEALRSYDSLLLKYIKVKLGNQLLIASAGNNSVNTDICFHFPSAFSDSRYGTDNLISVTAVDQKNYKELASYANCGENTVTLAAVGNYEDRKGTSYATPRITNIALDYWSSNPSLSMQMVKTCIEESVIPGSLPIKKKGVLISAALDCDSN